MAEDFGTGVSRTLSALMRQFNGVVWQADKPPLDSELNLMFQIDLERVQQLVRTNIHSGFFLDPTHAVNDYVTASNWSNFFKFGNQATGETSPMVYANVNGWIIPVSGTGVSGGDTSNRVNLNPPPATDARIDFIFLEVWRAQVAPNPSTVSKPSASTIWTYGNVEYGGTNISDDLEDPAIGFETTERIQLQYRIRVLGGGAGLGTSVALDEFPDGLDDPNVLGQGTAASPVGGFTFTNMRDALGDPGLWRAGTGVASNSLGTVDGYTYAIPICAVFRRDSEAFVARTTGGNANQNGAFDRNPSAALLPDPRDGAKVLATATLTNGISEITTGVIQITNLTDSGWDDSQLNPTSTFMILDDEIIGIDSVDTTTSPATITISATTGRGRWATMALPHDAGTAVRFYNTRPDGRFSDEISDVDILDLRKGVNFGDWDYQRILQHNLSLLLQNDLRSSYKQSGVTAGDVEGSDIPEIDTLYAVGGTDVPSQTAALDGPDGIRTIFSDSASLQTDVTILLQDQPGGGAVGSWDSNSINEWSVGATFQPSGFAAGATWSDGTVIQLYIGGADGSSGARGTFRAGGERAVRFVGPREFWQTDRPDGERGLQHPVTLRYIAEGAMAPAGGSEPLIEHPGPQYPLSDRFEKPFCFLGGILNPASAVGAPEVYNAPEEVRLPGLNFDLSGDWFTKTGGVFNDDPSLVSNPVLRSQRTLWSMLTNNGADRSGLSSEVYLVLWGDGGTPLTNGVYQVIGAGATAGYTTSPSTALDRVRVRFIRAVGAGSTFALSPGSLTNAELRSQYTNAEDGAGSGTGPAAAVVVLTDVHGTSGGSSNPWNTANLGTLTLGTPILGKLAIRTTLQYHPGRGAMARVPLDLWRVNLITPSGDYLRRTKESVDANGFSSSTGSPSDESFYEPVHIQTWNRLCANGLDAPQAPGYGGAIVSGLSEQDRDAEAFFDLGSKTLLFRPFQTKNMTMQAITITTSRLFPQLYTAGGAVDGHGLYSGVEDVGYPLPPEYMPRFGRQDIPFFVDNSSPLGSLQFLSGINHLFTDTLAITENQFEIIGGVDNTTAGPSIQPMLFQTGSTGNTYGEADTLASRQIYQARLYSDIDVVSTDVGRGLEGIQLPPFAGIARLYGVYHRQDFIDAGGDTFQTDRVTPLPTTAPNLLRTDVNKQTLFILQGGAEDVTGNAGDHTYIVPSDVVDIRLANNFTTGDTFATTDFVVEATIFGFARGFINLNNYVLQRQHNGNGDVRVSPFTTEFTNIRMTLPAPAQAGDQLYTGYTRRVYQGDPYMTRDGSTRTDSDYVTRYGQVSQADAFELSNSIQQYDSEGNTIVETPNLRSLEVLASMEFWTTLGTGKVGGSLYPGTVTDVGFTQNTPEAASRIPAASSDPRWRVLSRAFTEGHKTQDTHARIQLVVLDFSIGGSSLIITRVDGSQAVIPIAASASNVASATAIVASINGGVYDLGFTVTAWNDESPVVTIQAVESGPDGNLISVRITDTDAVALRRGFPSDGSLQNVTQTTLAGGVNTPVNGGIGISQLKLTGMTERLPLGILLQDADFMGEDPLSTMESVFGSSMGGIKPFQSLLPLTTSESGATVEYTRLVGGAGHWVGMSDGSILQYGAYNAITNPTGTKSFRLYRGGGAGFVLTDPQPGGPIDWVSGAFPKALAPVLKGGLLTAKALLVRNFHEEAFAGDETTTHGSEIQMVIVTRGMLGRGSTQTTGVTFNGVISPTGFGEGYAAADRYRLEGKPLARRVQAPLDPNVPLAVFPGDTDEANICG